MRTLRNLVTVTDAHWVGNGFPVSTLFSYQSDPDAYSPFLLLDYAGPVEFGVAQRPRGVSKHPHRGFETVTIVYQGEIEHRDSHGHGGIIGPGDVQWMTAGSGIIHEEMHSQAFAHSGGTLEMVQLWVNLPAARKMMPPRYQSITATDIPSGDFASAGLSDNAHSTFRVIAGSFAGLTGPARTNTDMLVMDAQISAGDKVKIPLPAHWNLTLTVLTGTVLINDSTVGRDASLATFANDGDYIVVEANNSARLLITAGEPINEPVVGQGPFIMNTAEEIAQAIRDYEAGKLHPTSTEI